MVLTEFSLDTLLNVFLAIAVDNLTNAEILTHDEEAAETKRMKNNLQQAFECDKTLGLNALSFVNNLQAQIGDDRLSVRDRDINGGQSSFDLLSTTQDIQTVQSVSNGLVITTKIPITVENGNPLTPESYMRKRKSVGLFDQVLLEVPGNIYVSPAKEQ